MIRIVFKSYDYKVLNIFLNYLKTSKVLTSEFKIVYLPTKTKKITLLRSPHVYKKSKDQYQEKIFKVLIQFSKKDFILSKQLYWLINLPRTISFKIYSK